MPARGGLALRGASFGGYGGDYCASSTLVAAPVSIITTVAGGGANDGATYTGPATAAGLYLPEGAAVDGSGNLFIADTSNDVIREVNASTHVITTVAGGGANSGADLQRSSHRRGAQPT